jgi:hypothetical protein
LWRRSFSFAKIVGVGLSQHFGIEAQKKNIKRYRPASQQYTAFHLQCMNVVGDVLGQEALVPFLADPVGRETVGSAIANLEASLSATPREALIVDIYPQFEDLWRSSACFEG